jgi:hypothetical protein
MDIEIVVTRLYESEINCAISCFWDKGRDVKLGDEMNGFVVRKITSGHWALWDTEKPGRSSKPAPAGIKNAKRRGSDSHAEAAKHKEIQGFGISA